MTKFDCIIMNPPYKRNLHLKILATAIQHLNDDGICINLSPVRWLQDPFAKYNTNSDYYKFEESVGKHIFNINTFNFDIVNSAFDMCKIGAQLGIYHIIKNNQHILYKTIFKNRITDKIVKFLTANMPNIEKNKYLGWRVRIPSIPATTKLVNNTPIYNIGRLLIFHDGKDENGRIWHQCYGQNQYTKKRLEITASILFENKQQAENFVNSYNTQFIRYLNASFLMNRSNINSAQIVYLANTTNPRTGLKGYESEWTNEDFYTIFNITKAEQQIIEQEMKKYEINR